SSRRHLPGECSIYKVPLHLRKLNKEAHTPQVISIGPFHHGNKKLQILEKYKLRYLKDFMRPANTNPENLIRIVKGSEERIRQCYAETIEIDSDEFVKMTLLDATFIIEYFLRNIMFTVQWTDEDRTVIKPWITARMQLDFLLLENQLPLFILKDLYQLVLVTNRIMYCPFIEVVFRYFHFLNTQKKFSDSDQFNGIIHFVDLFRIFYLPETLSERQPGSRAEKICCATQLAKAGLTLRRVKASATLIDIKYHEGGVLEIPPFTIDNTTEIFARNLMALEQCHYPTQTYITDYFFLLDFLIDTDKDVALLADKKILVNGMGDDNATFINNLGTNVQYSSMNSEYCRLCRDLAEFRDDSWHRWKAIFKRDYVSTPWKIVATIAAILLLALTLTQAVCSIISV
ncbi:hypothetical protein I3842_04G148500, partial [Carya illinoinensis]